MTIYEQIQRSLDWIEAGLSGPLSLEGAADAAGMSVRSFSHWFWAITGRSYKEYVVRRRLSEGLTLLVSGDRAIIDIALSVGYGSHAAFSRAFRSEFGMPPLSCRKVRPDLRGTERLELVKEMYMGIVIKELPETLAVSFSAWGEDSELKAAALREAWMAANPPASGRPRRIFGYNIDAEGRLSCDPQNIGYRLLVSLEGGAEADRVRASGGTVELIGAGRFAVTGVEGRREDAGTFIPSGWARMNEMMEAKGLSPKSPPRWFEEELEPSAPGNLRLDLSLEIG